MTDALLARLDARKYVTLASLHVTTGARRGSVPTAISSVNIVQATIDTLESTRRINLRNKRINDEGARALAEALTTNETVTGIDLAFNQIGNEGASALAKALETNKTVADILLASNQIGDEGAHELAKMLKTNKTITSIVLMDNQISDRGAQSLAEALKKNKTVTSIDLWNNQIGDSGARAILNMLATNRTIECIDVRSNDVAELIETAIVRKARDNMIRALALTLETMRRNMQVGMMGPGYETVVRALVNKKMEKAHACLPLTDAERAIFTNLTARHLAAVKFDQDARAARARDDDDTGSNKRARARAALTMTGARVPHGVPTTKLGQITTKDGLVFTVSRLGAAENNEYILTPEADSTRLAGRLELTLEPAVLELTSVGILAPYRGQALCRPFVVRALQDVLVRLDSPPPSARVTLDTDHPRRALRCYTDAFVAVGYTRVSGGDDDPADIIEYPEIDHGDGTTTVLYTIADFERAKSDGQILLNGWHETVTFRRMGAAAARAPLSAQLVATSGPKRTRGGGGIDADDEEYTQYGAEEKHVVIGQVANKFGQSFTVARFVRKDARDGLSEYELTDDARNGRLAGEAGITFSAAALTIDLVTIHNDAVIDYRGQKLCSPFLALALQDTVAHHLGGVLPPVGVVALETYDPGAATRCYTNAFFAVGYNDYTSSGVEPVPIICDDESDYSDDVEYADTIKKYEEALRRGHVDEEWRETLTFTRNAPPPSRTRLDPGRALPPIDVLDDVIAAAIVRPSDTDVRGGLGGSRPPIEQGYGEVLLAFSAWMVAALAIDESNTFIDIGSGTGNVLAHVAGLTGADAIGYDNNPALVAVATRNLAVVRSALGARGYTMGQASSRDGDALRPLPLPLLAEGKAVIFINNFLFRDLSAHMVYSLVVNSALPVGTRLLLVVPISWSGRPGAADEELFRRLVMPPRLLATPANVVSWSPARRLAPVLYEVRARNDDTRFWHTHHRAYTNMLRVERGSVNIGER